MNLETEKTPRCENCRNDINCSASTGGCWCFDIEIRPEILLKIGKVYGNCLCRTCLTEISAKFDADGFTQDKTSK
jgi:hypothetical protein